MIRTATATIFALLAALPACADSITGLARIRDGDSLVVEGRQIRLAGVDAPEMTQPEGRYTLAALRRHVHDRPVTCTGDEIDRYDRLVAICTVAGQSINLWLVERGLAFAYWPWRAADLTRRDCPRPGLRECHRTTAALLAAEDAAREARRGFWHFDPPPVYPGCVRHAERLRCRAP